MCRTYKMTWEKSKQRWRKMHRGRIYTVTPQSLGCSPTKDESYRTANAWWDAKLTEIKPQSSSRFDHLVTELEAHKDSSILSRRHEYMIDYGQRCAMDSNIHESEVREIVPPSENLLLWGELLSGVKKPTPTDRTISHWIGKFLALRKDEVIARELSVAQYDLNRLCLEKVQDWIGDRSIDTITPDRWVEWYRRLLGLDISVE